MFLLLAAYGIVCVLVTLGWGEYLKHRERMAAAREECERYGHDWGEPFQAMGQWARDCRRCKRQEHRREDGDWR